MTKRMLIDANHPEETRVVILDGSRVEEFDFEAASKRPLKGNIYLAKVTRVEPSLQAAFVEYGGNRQGFLAFAEIHPDYYQIPVADRQALLAEQEAEARRRSEDDIESFDMSGPKAQVDEEAEEEDDTAEDAEGEAEMAPLVPLDAAPDAEDDHASSETPDGEEQEVFVNHGGAAVHHEVEHDHDHDEEAPAGDDQGDAEAIAAEENEGAIEAVEPSEGHNQIVEGEILPLGEGEQPAEGEDNGEAQALRSERPNQKWVRKKHYKIQEVIKRRQIILVQVVKEERGNKGAALTTYLSLAGRYCVLMPNTPRGGGISRKITNAADRKRLKSAAQGLELPEGMGLIIRTAGENRTKLEIRRDYDYLLRLWDTIREKTLASNAPACVYEEGDLIKRVIRDLYTKDVQDVVVEGEQGYQNAKDFMRMLMPSHAKNVHHYKDSVPLYQRMHIEAQLDSMFSPTVTLKSGGYIVINQTEALVSVDVNSGRATREHSIEETARKTNLEAASEVGRQLRLRDLAGLIVIDFIDMEESRNDREVEKRLRDAVKNDRARVQIGKISQFGLMEMSRQRLRAGVVAGSTVTCPHCEGLGLVRSVESTALRVLRGIEEEGEKNRAAAVTVKIANDVAIYILNQKRHDVARLEAEHGIEISFEPATGLAAGNFELERTKQRDPSERPRNHAVSIEAGFVPSNDPDIEEEIVEEDEIEEIEVDSGDDEESTERAAPQAREGERTERAGGEREGGKRRRRGGRGRNRDRDGQRPTGADSAPAAERVETAASEEGEFEPAVAGGEPVEGQVAGENGEHRRKRRRRRGRRGGRERDANGQPVEGDAVEAQSSGGQTSKPARAPAPNRFGDVPDEIDTTPGAVPHTPGAPSTPVWTLKDDVPDTTPSDAPVKKGWWQKIL
jgi:ribonuclease E